MLELKKKAGRCAVGQLLIFAAMVFAAASTVRAQEGPVSIEIHLSHNVDTKYLQIHYVLFGSFGASGSFIRTDTKKWDYKLPLSNEGVMAKSLKVAIYG